jgi:hypothetical protein
MSRGLGVWQRGILAAVECYGMVYLRDLLPDDARKSDRNAVERAAWRLVAAGRIAMVVFAHGRPRLLAVRPRLPVSGRPRRAARRPLSVGDVLPENSAHTYASPSRDIVPVWPAERQTRVTQRGGTV